MQARQPIADEKISLANYKIDYSRRLGSGVYGTVYAIAPRPENEKGFFSANFPFIYDYLFPVTQAYSSEQYCVKSFHSMLRITWENLDKDWSLERVKMIWNQPADERNTHATLSRHGLTQLQFFEGNNHFQLKTRVKGKTFRQYIEEKSFTNLDQFILRKSFIDFLRLMQKPKLKFNDIHQNNIMYDEKNHCWEIIDGEITESKQADDKNDQDNISRLIDSLVPQYEKETYAVFMYLARFARSPLEYTKLADETLLKKMTSLKDNYSAYSGTLTKQLHPKKTASKKLASNENELLKFAIQTGQNDLLKLCLNLK
jgi:hypothetical protein